jgi:anti-anti-sigma factor
VGLRDDTSTGVTTLTPEKPLLEENVAPLRAELDACLAAGGLRVVLDLGSVPFIDSRGLEFLVDAARRLRTAGGRLKLANPNPLCSEILSATRVDREVEVCFDLHQAGRSFR